MVIIEVNDRFLPNERQVWMTDEEPGASVPVRTPVIDVIVPTIVATVPMVAVT